MCAPSPSLLLCFSLFLLFLLLSCSVAASVCQVDWEREPLPFVCPPCRSIIGLITAWAAGERTHPSDWLRSKMLIGPKCHTRIILDADLWTRTIFDFYPDQNVPLSDVRREFPAIADAPPLQCDTLDMAWTRYYFHSSAIVYQRLVIIISTLRGKSVRARGFFQASGSENLIFQWKNNCFMKGFLHFQLKTN